MFKTIHNASSVQHRKLRLLFFFFFLFFPFVSSILSSGSISYSSYIKT